MNTTTRTAGTIVVAGAIAVIVGLLLQHLDAPLRPPIVHAATSVHRTRHVPTFDDLEAGDGIVTVAIGDPTSVDQIVPGRFAQYCEALVVETHSGTISVGSTIEVSCAIVGNRGTDEYELPTSPWPAGSTHTLAVRRLGARWIAEPVTVTAGTIEIPGTAQRMSVDAFRAADGTP